MRKKEFLAELEEHLIGVPKDDKAEIMQDYEEHFKAGRKEKRTESEISKSLGNPKMIARDVRKELSNDREIKDEAIETWVAAKKLAKHVFAEARDKAESFIKSEKKKFRKGKFTKELWVGLAIFLLLLITGSAFLGIGLIALICYCAVKYIKNKSLLKIILSLLFNLLFFVWVWISAFFALIGLFISGIAIIVGGALMLAFSIFALVQYNTELAKDIFLSVLFAGIGTIILGGLFTGIFEKVITWFFKFTKKYIEFNMKVVQK